MPSVIELVFDLVEAAKDFSAKTVEFPTRKAFCHLDSPSEETLQSQVQCYFQGIQINSNSTFWNHYETLQ